MDHTDAENARPLVTILSDMTGDPVCNLSLAILFDSAMHDTRLSLEPLISLVVSLSPLKVQSRTVPRVNLTAQNHASL
jgi:hypothetical protein